MNKRTKSNDHAPEVCATGGISYGKLHRRWGERIYRIDGKKGNECIQKLFSKVWKMRRGSACLFHVPNATAKLLTKDLAQSNHRCDRPKSQRSYLIDYVLISIARTQD